MDSKYSDEEIYAALAGIEESTKLMSEAIRGVEKGLDVISGHLKNKEILASLLNSNSDEVSIINTDNRQDKEYEIDAKKYEVDWYDDRPTHGYAEPVYCARKIGMGHRTCEFPFQSLEDRMLAPVGIKGCPGCMDGAKNG